MNAPTSGPTPADPETTWFLYLIRCKDGALYTGITTDVDRRFVEHQSGKGAKYLHGKTPLTLVFQQKDQFTLRSTQNRSFNQTIIQSR